MRWPGNNQLNEEHSRSACWSIWIRLKKLTTTFGDEQDQQRAAKAKEKLLKDTVQSGKGGAAGKENYDHKATVSTSLTGTTSIASSSKPQSKVSDLPRAAPDALPSVASSPLSLFLHLDPPRSAKSLNAKISKEQIHQSILRLALQYADFKIVGANARCIAMLEAFKDVSI